MCGVGDLPDWLEGGVESSLRDTEDDNPVAAMPVNPMTMPSAQQRSKGLASPIILTPHSGSSPVGGGLGNAGLKVPWTDLDKFYEEDKEDEGEGESEDDDSVHHSSESGESDSEEDGVEDWDDDKRMTHKPL
jgi:hypothetical protein